MPFVSQRSNRRTIVRQRRNVNFLLTPTVPGVACAPPLQSFRYWLRNDASVSLSDVLLPPSARITLALRDVYPVTH